MRIDIVLKNPTVIKLLANGYCLFKITSHIEYYEKDGVFYQSSNNSYELQETPVDTSAELALQYRKFKAWGIYAIK